jgi:hypothetical protein
MLAFFAASRVLYTLYNVTNIPWVQKMLQNKTEKQGNIVGRKFIKKFKKFCEPQRLMPF